MLNASPDSLTPSEPFDFEFQPGPARAYEGRFNLNDSTATMPAIVREEWLDVLIKGF